MFDINVWLWRNRRPDYNRLADKLVCADGFELSVQASSGHYCEPREDGCRYYTAFEVGYPTSEEPLLLPYAEDASNPTDTVYGWVPVSVIHKVVKAHGGVARPS